MFASLESFMYFCDNMLITLEEKGLLPLTVRRYTKECEKLSSSVDSLLNEIESENSEKFIKHAIEKHANYDTAKKYFKKNKEVSYFKTKEDLRDLTYKAIRASRNEIIYLLFYKHTDLTVTYGYQMPIGRIHVGELTINEDAHDKPVTAIRMGIIKVGENENGVPILKLKSVYPIADKKRIFRLK